MTERYPEEVAELQQSKFDQQVSHLEKSLARSDKSLQAAISADHAANIERFSRDVERAQERLTTVLDAGASSIAITADTRFPARPETWIRYGCRDFDRVAEDTYVTCMGGLTAPHLNDPEPDVSAAQARCACVREEMRERLYEFADSDRRINVRIVASRAHAACR